MQNQFCSYDIICKEFSSKLSGNLLAKAENPIRPTLKMIYFSAPLLVHRLNLLYRFNCSKRRESHVRKTRRIKRLVGPKILTEKIDSKQCEIK